MRSLAIGFVLGAALLQTQADLPSRYVLFPVLVLAACLVPMARRLRTAGLRIAATLACGALAGFAWAGLFALHHLSRELPAEWEGRDITLVGIVDNLPSRLEQGMRFNFTVERVLAPAEAAGAVPERIALSWYADRGADARNAAPQLQPGERWRLNVRLRRPHGNANPHGFDYEVWLLEQNLRATGYVRTGRDADSANERLDQFVLRPGTLVERCRAWLQARIDAALTDKPYAGVIAALVIGDQRAIAHGE
jgi:competence protein ComEC